MAPRTPSERTEIVVPGEGDLPCDFLLVGERPGWTESRMRRPFVGPAGKELSRFINRADWRIDNLIPVYTGSNDDKPTAEEIARWAPALEQTIRRCRPRLVVTTGLYSTRYFLGPDASMDTHHGLVHEAPGRGFWILPCYHPAAGLHSPELYQAPLRADFAVVRDVIDAIDGDREAEVDVHTPHDPTAEVYTEDTHYLDRMPAGAILAIDREGPATAPECFTAAWGLRVGVLVRSDDGRALGRLTAAVDRAQLVVLHGALDDLRALATVGIRPRAWVDTLILAYLAHESKGLKTLGYRLHGRRMDDYLDLIAPVDAAWCKGALETGLRKYSGRWAKYGVSKRILTSLTSMIEKPGRESLRSRWSKSTYAAHVPLPPAPSWKDLDPAIGVPYACVDAIETRACYRPLTRRVREIGLGSLYTIDAGVIPFLARIADVGLKVDRTILDRLAGDLRDEYDRTCRKIEKAVGYPLNPLSPTKVSDALFDDLGVTPTKPGKDRVHYKTGDKYLKARQKEHRAIPLIMDAREISKMRGTYAERLPQLLRDGRYHPDFQYCATPTARLTEECIVLIPKHTERGKQIRRAFVAGEDHVILSTDASQIEMRVMAHESQDRLLLDVYKRNGDNHADTAFHLLGAPKNPEAQDESRHRLPAKTLNFGILNAITEIGLSEQLQSHGLTEWDEDACRDFLDSWFRIHDGVADYRRRQINHGKRHGYICDLYGRRISVAGLHSTDGQVRARTERRCLSGIQSGAQGLMRKWIANVWDEVFCGGRFPPAPTGYIQPWCFLHDDLLIECTASWAPLVATRVQSLMPQDLCIPVTGDSKIGENWGDLRKLPKAA